MNKIKVSHVLFLVTISLLVYLIARVENQRNSVSKVTSAEVENNVDDKQVAQVVQSGDEITTEPVSEFVVKDKAAFLSNGQIDIAKVSIDESLIFQLFGYTAEQTLLANKLNISLNGSDGDECSTEENFAFDFTKSNYNSSLVQDCFYGKLNESKSYVSANGVDGDGKTVAKEYIQKILNNADKSMKGYGIGDYTKKFSVKPVKGNSGQDLVEVKVSFEEARTDVVRETYDYIFKFQPDGKLNYVKLPNVYGYDEYQFSYN